MTHCVFLISGPNDTISHYYDVAEHAESAVSLSLHCEPSPVWKVGILRQPALWDSPLRLRPSPPIALPVVAPPSPPTPPQHSDSVHVLQTEWKWEHPLPFIQTHSHCAVAHEGQELYELTAGIYCVTRRPQR